jgi:hypothetical protein
MELECSSPHSQKPDTCRYPEPAGYQSGSAAYSLTVSQHCSYYGEELLAPRPTPNLEDPLIGCPRLLLSYFPYWRSPHVVYLLVTALHILRLRMSVAHDKFLYVIALPVTRLHSVVSYFTTTCYIVHNTWVIFRQVRVTWSDRREERTIWRCTLWYNSAKLYEPDCLLGAGCPVRYSRICPPVTETNAIFRFQNIPFPDPFLSWSTQPTFTRPIAILPFWYLGRD